VIHVAISYSHKDELMRDALKAHLRIYEREGLVKVWHDRQLAPGEDIDRSIFKKFDTADIVLLLVSSDFINSDYCWSKEMRRALDRRTRGEVSVIPFILQPCQWRSAPFGALLALPPDGKPVASWSNADEAYDQVARQVAEAARVISRRRSQVRSREDPIRAAREDILEKLSFARRLNDDDSWWFLGEAVERHRPTVHDAFAGSERTCVDQLIQLVTAQNPSNRVQCHQEAAVVEAGPSVSASTQQLSASKEGRQRRETGEVAGYSSVGRSGVLPPGASAGRSLRSAARRRSIRRHPMGRVALVLAKNSATSSGLGGGTSGGVVDMASRTPWGGNNGPRWGLLAWFKGAEFSPQGGWESAAQKWKLVICEPRSNPTTRFGPQ